MTNLLFSNPLAFFIIFPGLLLSITVHEFAHAFTADKLGDPTPRFQGRITLDPRAHLDPLGVIMILLTRFGWGKPVEFDSYNLKNPQRDTALIALAGPVSNLIIALLISLFLRAELLPQLWVMTGLFQVMVINVVLAIFNLVPVHPLDGSKILMSFLPAEQAIEYESFMHRYGMFVLIALIIPWNGVSPVSSLIWPVVSFIVDFLI
ncbi:MAG: site-2 protease family protein [Candidatus Pacebacteria bacterium]|nr:site-2 protease family protein [Candidatus Paceibacterota bacterium]